MSRLKQHLKEAFGVSIIPQKPFSADPFYTTADSTMEHRYDLLRELNVECRIRAKTYVDPHKEGADRIASAGLKRMIIEEVFGEFMPALVKIERALFEHDIAAAHDGLRALRSQMFD